MKIGFVGLGRMGIPLIEKATESGDIEVVGYDASDDARAQAANKGIAVADDLGAMVGQLSSPRLVWLMVPAAVVTQVTEQLFPQMSEGDIIVDGGNSDFEHSVKTREAVEGHGLGFVSCGVSGGVTGARKGPPISVSAPKDAFETARPVFDALGGNFSYFEEPRKGHLGKIIHNAIEYGMMQSIAEGVALYRRHGFSEEEIKRIFTIWSKGSIIESRLINHLVDILNNEDTSTKTRLKQSETVTKVRNVLFEDGYAPSIEAACRKREHPEELDDTQAWVLAYLRQYFGGHAIVKE